jgi:hypothetical protein
VAQLVVFVQITEQAPGVTVQGIPTSPQEVFVPSGFSQGKAQATSGLQTESQSGQWQWIG